MNTEVLSFFSIVTATRFSSQIFTCTPVAVDDTVWTNRRPQPVVAGCGAVGVVHAAIVVDFEHWKLVEAVGFFCFSLS